MNLIIISGEFTFKDDLSRNRNVSFEKLSQQIKNERYQISNLCRCGCLLKILEIMNNNKKCFSQIMTEESAFFDVDFEVVSSFKHEIAGIVSSFSQNFIEVACQLNNSIRWIYENHSKYIWAEFFKPKASCKEKSQYQYKKLGNCDDVNFSESEKETIEKLLKTLEINIKEKVKTEIINYFEINGGNDKEKLLFVMKNIYFPKIIDEIDFLGYEKVLTCINRKRINELFKSVLKFQTELRKYSDLPRNKQQIYENIDDYKMKIDLFKTKYSICSNEIN